MSKSPTMNLAADPDEDDRAWSSDQDAPRWHLRLSLPPGAAQEAIPETMKALIASMLDAILYRRRALLMEQPGSTVRWRVPIRKQDIRDPPSYWRELQALLERFWSARLRLELAEHDALPRITFETTLPVDHRAGSPVQTRPDSTRPATAVVFAPDIDSLAATSRLLDTQQTPPVLVMCDAITSHHATSRAALTSILDACHESIATITVHAPLEQEHLLDAAILASPEDWRLLHVLAAVPVAMSCRISEIQVPQNGVTNLNLPVTAEAISRPAQSLDPELASSMSHLLSRMTASKLQIRNPLLANTPSELVADLIERSPGRLGVDIDAICGLIQNDNTYEKRVDHYVSILGALHADSSLAEQYELRLMHDLLLPTNLRLADTYVRSIRELPAMSDRDVISHLDENAAGRVTGRSRHALAIGLLRRHAESVRHVLTRAMRRYAHDFVAGTLASTCLLVRAALPGDLRPHASTARKPVFRKLSEETDCWEIWYERGEPLYIKGSKGLSYIHTLLQSPGRTFSSAELRDAVAGHGHLPAGNLGPLADAQAIRRYQHRLNELRADLDIAVEHNDIGRKDKIIYEIDALEQELSRSVGLGGRLRQNSDAERARKSVSNAIHRALQQVRTQHPSLCRHLTATLNIGNGLSYEPIDGSDWET